MEEKNHNKHTDTNRKEINASPSLPSGTEKTKSSKEFLFLDPSTDSSPFLLKQTTTASKLKPSFQPLPPSSVLARVKDFLPKIAEANKELLEKSPGMVNIENVDESTPYIKMNLALGVLEEQTEITEDTIKISSATNNTENFPSIVMLN